MVTTAAFSSREPASSGDFPLVAGLFASLCAVLASSGCPVAPGETNNNNVPLPTCGNGTLEPPEQCEGADLNGETCQSRGFGGGELSCANCWLDTSGCNACGNDLCDPDETRATCPADCGVKTIAAGSDYTCAALGDGSAWCWGNNTYGALGDGTTQSSSLPVQVSELNDVSNISVASTHACALLDDGSVWCWGKNDNDQLGYEGPGYSASPVKVAAIVGAAEVACGAWHTCVRLDSGSAKCWGSNASGALGDGNMGLNSASPVGVSGLTSVTSIASGAGHTCATVDDGTIWCWGSNSAGELGNGQPSLENSDVPVQVVNITNSFGLGRNSGVGANCALLSDLTLWCWGGNEFGNLGDGTYENVRPAPVQVEGLSNVPMATLGTTHSCAALGNGAAYCWGVMSTVAQYGQLGTGTNSGSELPVEVVDLEDVRTISAGGYSTCAALRDGSAYCWGLNYSGQLGVGDLPESSAVPLEVVFP
ncbi:MAG: hypothetical protein ABI333_30240 [bacterium]